MLTYSNPVLDYSSNPLVEAEKSIPATTATPAASTVDPPAMRSRVAAACLSHAARDFAGQTVGRVLGLCCYSLMATLSETPARIASGIVGAGAGGRVAYLIARRQIGSDTYGQRAAVGACTVAGMLIGGVITGMGSNALVSGLATGSLCTAAISLSSKCATESDREHINDLKTGAALGMSFAGIGIAAYIDHQWKAGSNLYPARNLGLVIESTVIEIGKSSFERYGPSVDRNALNFEGKVIATLLGMAPYVAATVLLNGYVTSLIQPDRDSSDIGELIAPMIVGAIANAVRGLTNAFAVHWVHSHAPFAKDSNSDNLRDHAGARWPEKQTVINKACIRFALSACRNAVYARLRDTGMTVAEASMIAQGVYACYAQCRDLIHDVARGEGWSQPRVAARSQSGTT